MIFTNRLNYKIDYDAMNRDFFCMKVTGTHKEDGKPPLPYDLIQQIADDCQPISVMHQLGNSMYILFPKHLTREAEVIEKLQESNEYRELGLTFSPIVFTPKEGESFDTHLTGYWVLQILFNSLVHNDPERLNPDYQNLFGRLFIPMPVKRHSRRYWDVFEIKVEKPSLLTIKVIRFARFETCDELSRWMNYNRKPGNVFFIYNKTSGAFIRSQDCFADLEKHGEVFVNRSNYSKTHATVNFIDTGSPDKLQHTRVGMCIRFLGDASALLGTYIKVLELLPMPKREYEHIKKPDLSIDQRVHEYYKNHEIMTIQLIDMCRDSDSTKLKCILNHHAKAFDIALKEKDASSELIQNDTPVIAILHNKDYYEGHEEKDPYLKGDSLIVQHVTVEDFLLEDEDMGSSTSHAKFLVLLRDIAIKRDLQQGKADFLSITEVGVYHQYSYYMAIGFGNRKGQPMEVYSIKIGDDFSIETSQYKDEPDGFELSLEDEIEKLRKDVQARINQYLQLEGWVENKAGERNYIFNTEEIVMPELPVLKKQMQDVAREIPDKLRSPEAIADHVRGFLSEKDAKVSPEKISELTDMLMKESQMLSKVRLQAILKKVFPIQSAAYRHLMKRFQDEFEVSFGISRGKSANDLHEYRAGLRYWEEDGIGYYFSGEWDLSGLQAAKARADHIRVVVPDNNSNLFFKDLLPGMNEEIVHMAARSVLPAGFKYVREFISSTE